MAADGLLRGLIPDTGDLALAPAKFLPPNATANGLIWADGFVYAATSNTCGGAPTAVCAMDFMAETKPVMTWQSNGAPIVGLALGADGTVYASTGSGARRIRQLDRGARRRTLKMKDWLRHDSAFNSTPVVFTEGEKTYVAVDVGQPAVRAGCGFARRRRPSNAALRDAGWPNVRFAHDGVATWRDPAGTRWILTEMSGAIGAFKVIDKGGVPAVERAWTSRTMPSPRTPIIVNGVVFALAGGGRRRECRALCAGSCDRQGALEQRKDDHVSRQRRAVGRHRPGVCRDGGQHGVVVRNSAGD